MSLPTHPSASPGGSDAPPAARRAKIVCTLGPVSASEAVMRDLLRRGMDVARLNFSHGTHEEHTRLIECVRRAAQSEKRSIAILQDLQGPKIRTGRLKERTAVALRKGRRVILTPRDVLGTSTLLSTTFPQLAQDVRPGDRILLSDGLIELRVRAIKGDDVECEVLNGGLLREHQGINVPGAALSVPALTDKDRKDLQFGLKHGVDLVALSFVRSPDDVREIKRLIASHAVGVQPPVIAKLEKPQAIDRLEEILEVTDGVMVARGDLGVEMAPELVPIVQKEIIRRAAYWRKPVITATQMLESMVQNPRPTRAEASDVANAIFDGSDALMLSAETASGRYPCEAVAMMARIIAEAESHLQAPPLRRQEHHGLSIAETICESVAHAAHDLNIRAIAVFTESGNTARLVSKYRPPAPICAFTPDPTVCNWTNVLWGVRPLLVDQVRSSQDMLQIAENELLRSGVLAAGDVMALITGTQMRSGATNVMRLHRVDRPEDRLPQKARQERSFKPLPHRRNR